MCIIDNQSNPVNQLYEGIEAALTTSIMKKSENGEKNCRYQQKSQLANLVPTKSPITYSIAQLLDSLNGAVLLEARQ